MSTDEEPAGGAPDEEAGLRAGSTEERAEEIVQRTTTTLTRVLTRAFARAREEAEDIVAEGRELHRNDFRRDA